MLERLLIVGLGSIGSRHLRIARELIPGVKIGLITHRSAMAEPLDADWCGTTLDEALRFQPQAAVLANPATRHLEFALPLARAGVHLLIEKPLSDSIRGVLELIDICRSKQLTLLIGYNLRYLPSLQRFHDLLQEKRVGAVYSVRAEVGQFLPSWRPGRDYRQSVSAKAALGGGVLLELSHEIDYLQWLFGRVEWVSAIQRKQSRLEVDVEDTAHLVLGFLCDAGAEPVIASLNMDFIRHDATRTCTVIGERGSLRWDALTGNVEIFEASASGWVLLFTGPAAKDQSYMDEWRYFLACVEDQVASATSGQDALAVLRVIEAARRSSATGSVVPISFQASAYANHGVT